MRNKHSILSGLIMIPMLLLNADTATGGGATATMVDLKNIDYMVIVDKSGSMGSMSGKEGGYPDRYTASKETVKGIVAEFAALDADGISGGVFGEHPQIQDGLDYTKFAAIFDANRPSGGTLIMPTLNAIFAKARESMKKGKQFLCHIIWDGAPNELNDSSTRQANLDIIGKAIAAFTQEMTEDGQVAIQFLQVGNAADEQIASFTEMLDDHLVSKYNAKFDIIDCKPLSWVSTQGSAQAIADEAFNG